MKSLKKSKEKISDKIKFIETTKGVNINLSAIKEYTLDDSGLSYTMELNDGSILSIDCKAFDAYIRPNIEIVNKKK